jgi:hypothetical protein
MTKEDAKFFMDNYEKVVRIINNGDATRSDIDALVEYQSIVLEALTCPLRSRSEAVVEARPISFKNSYPDLADLLDSICGTDE